MHERGLSMYLGDETLFAGALLLLVAAAGWFWNDSLRARERMLETCARLCRELKLQFLDETVALARLGVTRGTRGSLEITRDYVFEFSGTGQDRWQGRATLAGRRVVTVQFDHPEGVTIVGGSAPVSAELLRLARPERNERGSTPPH
jgi:hypothetical protein